MFIRSETQRYHEHGGGSAGTLGVRNAAAVVPAGVRPAALLRWFCRIRRREKQIVASGQATDRRHATSPSTPTRRKQVEYDKR